MAPFLAIARITELKTNDINNKINAKLHNALFSSDPITVFPIPCVKTDVNVAAGDVKFCGINAALPTTIWTAKASPKARAIPKTTAVKIPGVAARKMTL